MSGRRLNNRIRGPQSALTDFLAANNISAVQIRAQATQRQQAAQQAAAQLVAQETTEEGVEDVESNAEVNGEAEAEIEEEIETPEQKKRRLKKEQAVSKKTKESKANQKRKAAGYHDTDEEETLTWYAKPKPSAGDLENCELCDKRFTVTPYSKTGPNGQLLCPKCSREQEAGKKKDAKPKKQGVGRDKRRKTQSNLLDGIIRNGAKTLQELCVEKVAAHIADVDEFGDLPESLLDRLSQILSKRRIITSKTLELFLRPDIQTIAVYDCAKLEESDYTKIFAIIPKLESLNLRNAGQLKDRVIDYILERDVPLRHLQLEAANLISETKWREFFGKAGHRLETLKLAWLDYSLNDETMAFLAIGCPNLKRLKLKKCFRIGDPSLQAISQLTGLEHLSLRFILPITAEPLANLLRSVGSNLRTLSLEHFEDASDEILATIHSTCSRLRKLRFTENDYCTDAGFAALFTSWFNPPLSVVDLSSNRDLDNSNPDGPQDPVGLASNGFVALMTHSGSKLEKLDISSCRHISHRAFAAVFNGEKQYPLLREINISFLNTIDTNTVAGMFRSCPSMRKVTAFGCFGVSDVVVPVSVALIGVPKAQEAMIKEGRF